MQDRAISHYYHYTRSNDSLFSLIRSFTRAKRESTGCKWNFQPATWFHVKQSILLKYICTILPDVLIIMIITWLFRAYSLFVPLLASFATRATNKLYALHKSCDCPINIMSVMYACQEASNMRYNWSNARQSLLKFYTLVRGAEPERDSVIYYLPKVFQCDYSNRGKFFRKGPITLKILESCFLRGKLSSNG